MTIASLAIVAALSALALVVNPAAADTTVNISLVEFAVSASPGNAPTGVVSFQVKNNGVVFHSFLVAATNLPADGLPVDKQTNTVIEGQVNVVASTADLLPGESASVSPTLAPGNYVLFCNIPGHYTAGQFLAFQVTGGQPPTNTPGPGEPTATPGGPTATPGGPEPIDTPDGGTQPNATGGSDGSASVLPVAGAATGASSGKEWIAVVVAAAGAALIWAGALIYRRSEG